MIKYIVVDDDKKVLEYVRSKIESLSTEFELEQVNSYNSSKLAYEQVDPNDYDLLIVDFEMPVYNGIELAQKIGASKKIIFLTSTVNNEKQIINSIDVCGYLSKPFDIEEFQKIIKNKVLGKVVNSDQKTSYSAITLHIGANKDVKFQPKQVYYASTFRNRNGSQPSKNCLNIYGKEDEILYSNVRMSITDLHQKLEAHQFEKISKNTIINMEHIKERDNTNISLHNCSESFEVSAKEKPGLLAKLRKKMNL